MKNLNELLSLKGKRAVITGSASGIGRATALRFVEAGAEVHLIDVDIEGLESLKGKIESEFEVKVHIHRIDLSKNEEIEGFWKSAPPIDILVNNAGIYRFKSILEMDESFYRENMTVNLDSVFFMTRHFIEQTGKRHGIIVNVSSIEAFLPFARNLIHYDMAKLGVVALTRAIAKEFGRRIRANVVVPGGIETESVRRTRKRAILKMELDKIRTGLDFSRRLPVKRFGTPDEVARVVLFLSSEMASDINGAIIPVDGGFLSS